MKKLCLTFFALIPGTILCVSSTESSLGQFEKSKINSLNSKNEKKDNSNKRWAAVSDTLTSSEQHAQQLMNAHDKIHQYANVGQMAEKDLDKKVSGKNKSKIAKLRKVSTEAQRKSEGRLHRAENLSINLLKHLESAVTDAKKDIETSSKELLETQKTLAQSDAQAATQAPKKIAKKTDEKKEPKKSKKTSDKKQKETK